MNCVQPTKSFTTLFEEKSCMSIPYLLRCLKLSLSTRYDITCCMGLDFLVIWQFLFVVCKIAHGKWHLITKGTFFQVERC